MNNLTKAMLKSALLLPGAGHASLGRAARGLLFLLPSLACLIFLARELLPRTQLLMDQALSGELPPDPLLIAERVAALSANDGPWMSYAIVIVAVCWVAALVDLWLINNGARR